MQLETLEHHEVSQSRRITFSEQSTEEAQKLQYLAREQKIIVERDDVRSECSNLALQRSSLQSELQEAQKCVEMLADSRQPEEGFQEEVTRFRDELRTTRAELAARTAEPARLRQELLQSQSALQDARQEAQRLASQVEELEDEWW